ncbi:MAG: hypothetical protein HFF69_06310 [Oscillospiraceae bacterium]|nr:hypothetical protein [Oscillospiraceae bacterium]
MQMTSEEIVRDYMQAANKSKQIRILADLNAASPGEIRAVLAEAGVDGVKMPERIRQKKPEATASGSTAQERSVYDRIEAILAALPEDASDCIRNAAANLTVSIFSAYVEQRLGKEEVS